MIYYIIIFILCSYLIGSFSSAYWICKWVHKIDVREKGSKNAGATNVLRVFGYKTAIPVFIIDIFKAWVCVKFVHFIPGLENNDEIFYILKISFGVAAVIGHILPIYTGFKGGKGVASLLGVVIAIHLPASLIALLVFTLIFLISRIVSVSSMCAAVLFPLFIYLLEGVEIISLLVFSIIAAVLVLITHKKNIKRLIKGEEKRIIFKK